MKKTAPSEPGGIFFTAAAKKMKALRAAVFERQGNNCSKVPKYICTSLHPHSTNELK